MRRRLTRIFIYAIIILITLWALDRTAHSAYEIFIVTEEDLIPKRFNTSRGPVTVIISIDKVGDPSERKKGTTCFELYNNCMECVGDSYDSVNGPCVWCDVGYARLCESRSNSDALCKQVSENAQACMGYDGN